MTSSYKELMDINKRTHGNNWIYDNSFNECIRLKDNQPPNKLLPFLIGALKKDISPKDKDIKDYDGYYTKCIRGPSEDTLRPIYGFTQIEGTGYAKAVNKADLGDKLNNEINIFKDKNDKVIEPCWLPNDWRYAYLKNWNTPDYGSPSSNQNINLGIPKERLDCCLTKEGGTKNQSDKCPPEYCIDSTKCTGENSDPLKWCTNILDEKYLDGDEYDTVHKMKKIDYAKQLLNDPDCLKWLRNDNDNEIYYGSKLGKFFNKVSELLKNEKDEDKINDYLELLKTQGAIMYVRQLKSTSKFNKNIGDFCNNKGESKLFNFSKTNYDELVDKYGKICNCYWSEKLEGSPLYLYDKKIRELKNLNFSEDINKAFQYSSDVATKGNNKCWFQPCNDSNDTDLIPKDPVPSCPPVNTAMCGSQLDFKNEGTINAETIKLVTDCIANIESGIDPFPDNDEDVQSCEGGNAPLYGISKQNVDVFAYACNDYRNNIMRDKENIEGCKFCEKDRTCRTLTENNKDNVCEKEINICNLIGLEKINKLEEICTKNVGCDNKIMKDECKISKNASDCNNTYAEFNGENIECVWNGGERNSCDYYLPGKPESRKICNSKCEWCDNIEEYIKSPEFLLEAKKTCNPNTNNKIILQNSCDYFKNNNYNECDWCKDIEKVEENASGVIPSDKKPKDKKDKESFWDKYKWWIIGISIGVVLLIIIIIVIISSNTNKDFTEIEMDDYSNIIPQNV